MNSPTDRSALRQPPARQHIASGSPFEPTFGFSRALRIGDRVLVAGTGPVWPDGHCPDDPAEQARRCIAIIAAALSEAEATLDDVIRTRMFLTSADDSTAVGAVHGELFHQARPVATMVIVAGLVDPRWKVEIEAEAQLRSTVETSSTDETSSASETS